MHQTWLGPFACASGAEKGGVLRRRRFGRIRPLRRKMSANVLTDGSVAPGFLRMSASRSLRGPHVGLSRRACTIGHG